MPNESSPSQEPGVNLRASADRGSTIHQSVGDKNTNSWNKTTLTFLVIFVLGGFTVFTLKFGNFSFKIEKDEPEGNNRTDRPTQLAGLGFGFRDSGQIID